MKPMTLLEAKRMLAAVYCQQHLVALCADFGIDIRRAVVQLVELLDALYDNQLAMDSAQDSRGVKASHSDTLTNYRAAIETSVRESMCDTEGDA